MTEEEKKLKAAGLASSGATTAERLGKYEQGYTPSDRVEQMKSDLEAYQKTKPGAFDSGWDQKMKELYDNLANRKEFQFDLNKNLLYNQYKDAYTKQGKKAMEDTVANASALTGGYASSYAATAGSQAYQDYMNRLNDVIPSLYAQEYARWQDEGNRMKEQFTLANALRSNDYQAWQDAMDLYRQELADRKNDLRYEDETDYDRFMRDLNYWYGKSRDELSDRRYDQEWAYQKQRDAVSDSQWNKQFNYNVERNKASDEASRAAAEAKAQAEYKKALVSDAQFDALLEKFEQYEAKGDYDGFFEELYTISGGKGEDWIDEVLERLGRESLADIEGLHAAWTDARFGSSELLDKITAKNGNFLPKTSLKENLNY